MEKINTSQDYYLLVGETFIGTLPLKFVVALQKIQTGYAIYGTSVLSRPFNQSLSSVIINQDGLRYLQHIGSEVNAFRMQAYFRPCSLLKVLI